MMRERKIREMQLQRKHARKRIILLFAATILIPTLAYGVLKSSVKADSKPTAYKYYTDIRVYRDDTLWEIANTYMTEEYDSIDSYINEVCQINSIYNNEIYYGQKLVIPYYSNELK